METLAHRLCKDFSNSMVHVTTKCIESSSEWGFDRRMWEYCVFHSFRAMIGRIYLPAIGVTEHDDSRCLWISHYKCFL